MPILKKFPSKLVVSAVLWPSAFVLNETSNGNKVFLGYQGRFLSALCQGLKCECEVIVPPDNEWGRSMGVGNWTGMIGQLLRGESDIAVNLVQEEDVEAEVDFSKTYHVDYLSFATRLPKIIGTYGITQSFDHITWAFIFPIVLLMTILFSIDSKHKHSTFNRIFDLSSNLMRQFPQRDIFYRRYLFGIWLGFITLIDFFYIAGMSLLLTVPVYERPIRNFMDMSKAVSQGRYKIYFLRGGNGHETMSLATENESIIKMVETAVENDWFIDRINVTDDFFAGRTAFIFSDLLLQLQYGKPPISTKHIVSYQSCQRNIAIAIRRGFCCKSMINKVVYRLIKAGIHQKLVNDEIFKSYLKTSKSFKTSETHRPLSLQDIQKSLYLLMFGYTVAFIVFFIENIYAALFRT